MADGSIIIDTRIDTGGVSKGMNAVKAGMTRISAQVSKMGGFSKKFFPEADNSDNGPVSELREAGT